MVIESQRSEYTCPQVLCSEHGAAGALLFSMSGSSHNAQDVQRPRHAFRVNVRMHC